MVSQKVIHPLEGRQAVESGVLSCPVEPVKPSGEVRVSGLRCRIGEAVGPFAQEGLDEALGLAVGLGRVGSGEDVADAQPSQRLGEAAGAVGAAIVGHHPLGPDAVRTEPAQGAEQEGGGGVPALVAQHLDIGQPRRVIDRNMDEVPARAPIAAARAGAGDAMAGPVEPAELLDVEMDQLARPGALVTPHRLGRIEPGQPPHPRPCQPARPTVERARPSLAAIAATENQGNPTEIA